MLETILLVFWLAAIAPVVFTYAAIVLLYVSEFIVRRIAEYPKGPVVAAGAILAGIAGILKLLVRT